MYMYRGCGGLGKGGPACPKAGTTAYYLGLWEQVGISKTSL